MIFFKKNLSIIRNTILVSCSVLTILWGLTTLVYLSYTDQVLDSKGAIRQWIDDSLLKDVDWAYVPGTALDARMRAASDYFNRPSSDIKTDMGVQLLSSVLLSSPLHSQYWLSLASLKVAGSHSFDDVLTPYHLSYITGRWQSAVMHQRYILGLLIWEQLPEYMHSWIINDIRIFFASTQDTREKIVEINEIIMKKDKKYKEKIKNYLLLSNIYI